MPFRTISGARDWAAETAERHRVIGRPRQQSAISIAQRHHPPHPPHPPDPRIRRIAPHGCDIHPCSKQTGSLWSVYFISHGRKYSITTIKIQSSFLISFLRRPISAMQLSSGSVPVANSSSSFGHPAAGVAATSLQGGPLVVLLKKSLMSEPLER